jgi:hypothetical protein
MHLVEILLPADENLAAKRRAFARELTQRFGGVTAFSRSPAKGLYADDGKQVEDDIIVFEVMTETIDKAWWSALRKRLEEEHRQDEIVIRTSSVDRL